MSQRGTVPPVPAMDVFAVMRRYRRMQQKRFPFLKSPLDLDLVLEIGRYQERNRSITAKQLFLSHLGPMATVQRRLARLKTLGVVRQARSDRDQRVVRLSLNPRIMRDLDRITRKRRSP